MYVYVIFPDQADGAHAASQPPSGGGRAIRVLFSRMVLIWLSIMYSLTKF